MASVAIRGKFGAAMVANAENVIPATGSPIVLHFYWDGMFGSYSSPFGAIFDAKQNGLGKGEESAAAAAILDPERWAEESAALAQKFAYAAPVSEGTNPVFLTQEYETNAHNVATSQAALAAQRLANLLNAALK